MVTNKEAFTEDDYEAIIKKVPLKQGADVERQRARLRADIQAAAQWYIIRAEERKARDGETAKDTRAKFDNLADKLDAACGALGAVRNALKAFPPELRPRLHPSGRARSKRWRRMARLSPIAAAEVAAKVAAKAATRKFRALSSKARKIAGRIRVKRGHKSDADIQPIKILMTGWQHATGRSSFTTGQTDEFLDFAREVTSRLNKALRLKIANPSARQMRITGLSPIIRSAFGC